MRTKTIARSNASIHAEPAVKIKRPIFSINKTPDSDVLRGSNNVKQIDHHSSKNIDLGSPKIDDNVDRLDGCTETKENKENFTDYKVLTSPKKKPYKRINIHTNFTVLIDVPEFDNQREELNTLDGFCDENGTSNVDETLESTFTDEKAKSGKQKVRKRNSKRGINTNFKRLNMCRRTIFRKKSSKYFKRRANYRK